MVDPDRLRRPEERSDALHLDHLIALDAVVDVDRKRFASVCVDDIRRPKPPAVEQRIRDEVHRPQLVRRRGGRLPLAIGGTDAATRTLEPKAQSIFPVKPVDALVVDQPASLRSRM